MKNFKILLLLFTFSFLLFKLPCRAYAAASLSLSPATKTVEVGESFEVGVVLNTGGSNTDAADVILNYDATKLELVTAALGNLYENRLVTNTSISGKVTLRASSSAGSYFSGSGTFATLTFKGKAIGTGAVNFDFTANSTTDCNVAYAGSDILGSVANGSYTVVAAGTLPTSSPAGSPTSQPTQPVTGNFGLTAGVGAMGLLFLILGSLAILL
jgi:hypothetical protein